jgi:hypothetical protein
MHANWRSVMKYVFIYLFTSTDLVTVPLSCDRYT